MEDADGVVIPLRLSQRDIANFVGLTRETVNFILKDLRERNLIETQGRSIRLKNGFLTFSSDLLGFQHPPSLGLRRGCAA